MAGTVQMAPANSLLGEAAVEAKRRWDASGEGTVYAQEGALRILEPQYQPWMYEPTMRDARVRRAMVYALDREEIAGVLNDGLREYAAWSLVPQTNPLYPAAKDGLRPLTYDPARARALLEEAGWTVAPDGSLRHSSDGRPFHTAMWGTPGRDQETALYASYWRAIGMDAEEMVYSAARYADTAYRGSFPGWSMTGASFLSELKLSGPSNPRGFDDPLALRLVDGLETTIVEQEQLQAIKALNDYVLSDMEVAPIFYGVFYSAASKSVRAFDDMAGAEGQERAYGGYTRNARLWDIQ
jgi:ABC-type transport system substrate-binding protein